MALLRDRVHWVFQSPMISFVSNLARASNSRLAAKFSQSVPEVRNDRVVLLMSSSHRPERLSQLSIFGHNYKPQLGLIYDSKRAVLHSCISVCLYCANHIFRMVEYSIRYSFLSRRLH
jgi:hypothetical protein